MIKRREPKPLTNPPANTIKTRYFVSMPQSIRYIFNKKGSQLEATLIALVLSELFSLRYVYPKTMEEGGSFPVSISDISFYTGIDDTTVVKCLKRLKDSGMIRTGCFFPECYTKDSYHFLYSFSINDDLVSKFVELGEARFFEAKSEHFKIKAEANMPKDDLTLNCEDPDAFNF